MITSLKQPKHGFRVGDVFKKTWGPVTKDAIKEYAVATDTTYPIHTNDLVSRILGLKGVIAHGLMSCGIISDFIEQLVENGKILDCDYQMRGVIRPGDECIINAEVVELDGETVVFDITQMTRTKITLSENGKIVEKYNAYKRNWITPKDKQKGYIKKKTVGNAVLSYRLKPTIIGRIEYTITQSED